MKFTQVDGGKRGAPRTNTSDKTGSVRIVITMPSNEGNISRSLTIADAKVSEVYKALQETLVKQTA
jgi:hypothetical protein